MYEFLNYNLLLNSATSHPGSIQQADTQTCRDINKLILFDVYSVRKW